MVPVQNTQPASGIEGVFLRHREELARFLRARVPSEDADDLVQELWIKVQSMNSGPIADPLPYLYRMANNLAFDMRRSALRRQIRDRTWMTDLNPQDTEPPSISGERVLQSRDRLRVVESRLAKLGERTETVLRLFRVHGLPQARIAQELGISLSAVEKHLQKAYRTLAGLQNEDGDAA